MTNLLTVRDLKVEFHLHGATIHAVKGVSFRVRPGSTVAIVGESGSGKSVVSQAIMGILPRNGAITGGEILFNDPARNGETVDIAALPRDSRAMRAIRGGRISIVFQEPMTSLSPLHTVGDQISEALHLHREVSKAEGLELTKEMLRLVGFAKPARAVKTYPFELSGGLRQRAMIAMALICRPALLIADEPTTALDVTIQAQILKLISDLQHELGMAVLIITHDLGVVANVAEEVVVMYNGQVTERGMLEDIFRNPTHPYLRALLRAVPKFDMKPGERLVPVREIKPKTGMLLAAKEPWPAGADKAGPLLSTRGLCKTFHNRQGGFFGPKLEHEVIALDNVSLDIARGECLGLVGESGCGKTTFSKVITRALTADSGEVWFNDRGKRINVLALSAQELIPFRRRLQFIFQDPYGALNPRMTILDIISEPLVIHNIGDRAWRLEMVKELMELVGLDQRYLNRYPHSFSGGQRQRIGIARALALKPDLLICDEPVSALDVSIQAQILNLLKDLKDQLGLTYLFISHNLAVIDYICDRIAVMCAGRIVEVAQREALFRRPIHPYTRALFSAVPDPDPSRKLDLGALMEGKASIPAAWPAPFTVDGRGHAKLVEVETGHFVRVDPSADLQALAS
ncbi:MAG TPA: ABC transporter ATP-binding protein [Alphaproteobacteria bacterium]|nr:ABC transporter ATP-binding protein [Alphaproteobacteria bacterium]